jgi:inward rectifier potassium channel
MIPHPPRTPAARVIKTSFGLEFAKIGAQRYDFADPYHLALTVRWPTFVLGVFALYALITSLFAALYLAQPGCISGARTGSISDMLFFSIETLATVGYGEMAPASLYGHLVSSAEIITGMAFLAIMTGLIFVRFSKAKAKILFADVAVITRHNGRPTLMFRVANARTAVMTGLHVEANALVFETTEEGERYRRLQELPLARSSIPLFPMVLTLTHEIDERSPLAGMDVRALTESDLTVILSLEARDPLLAATVYDMKAYFARDIRWGMRFVEAVSQQDGRATADLTRLSLVEPDRIGARAEA